MRYSEPEPKPRKDTPYARPYSWLANLYVWPMFQCKWNVLSCSVHNFAKFMGIVLLSKLILLSCGIFIIFYSYLLFVLPNFAILFWFAFLFLFFHCRFQFCFQRAYDFTTTTLQSKATDTSKTFIVPKVFIYDNSDWICVKAHCIPFIHAKFHSSGSNGLAFT